MLHSDPSAAIAVLQKLRTGDRSGHVSSRGARLCISWCKENVLIVVKIVDGINISDVGTKHLDGIGWRALIDECGGSAQDLQKKKKKHQFILFTAVPNSVPELSSSSHFSDTYRSCTPNASQSLTSRVHLDGVELPSRDKILNRVKTPCRNFEAVQC